VAETGDLPIDPSSVIVDTSEEEAVVNIRFLPVAPAQTLLPVQNCSQNLATRPRSSSSALLGAEWMGKIS
jgi:hypothetical protein